ncbi:MAG: NAD-dependent deacylase [Thermoflexales bacterium]|nr:NAD-dependent deacylase [Thermoflexales bacterium]MDW8350873.1 NAD-dependent deacylase [Anaerolineae bacterium]
MEFPPDLLATLRAAHYIAALTGAGVSAESGVPTFRDAQTGLWAQFDPHELATPQAFRRNPKLVWDWYAWRRGLVERARPNPGHFALAEMERRAPRFTLITQNVDGLHQRAGSRAVIELHGNLRRFKCFVCEAPHPVLTAESTDAIPTCGCCGGLLRPDVVWFGEPLPAEAYRAALAAAQTCDVFLSIGTSGLVEPAASLPRIARRAGAVVVIVNPDAQIESPPDAYMVCGKAGEALPALVKAVWG